MLIMPDFVFNLLIYLLDLSPNGQVISPGQFDLMEGRKTQTSLYLKEMVEVRNSSIFHSSFVMFIVIGRKAI